MTSVALPAAKSRGGIDAVDVDGGESVEARGARLSVVDVDGGVVFAFADVLLDGRRGDARTTPEPLDLVEALGHLVEVASRAGHGRLVQRAHVAQVLRDVAKLRLELAYRGGDVAHGRERAATLACAPRAGRRPDGDRGGVDGRARPEHEEKHRRHAQDGDIPPVPRPKAHGRRRAFRVIASHPRCLRTRAPLSRAAPKCRGAHHPSRSQRPRGLITRTDLVRVWPSARSSYLRSLIHPPACQPYLSCDHIFSSGETDRRSRVIIMKQRFSRTHRRPVARGKVNELGRASTQARRASVPPPPSSALDQRFHRAISARFPRDHADASRRAYADASWRGHVPGSTDVPSVPARRE